MDRKVIRIPATEKLTEQKDPVLQKRRVAAYARVSTLLEQQQNSYTTQVSYYSSFIKAHEQWEFVKVYSDEGASGTGIEKREGFKTMISDALSGKIDLIITKSITRFARNTLDSISTIKKLKEKNVECFFEKENIWTFDPNSDLLIVVLSSISQNESFGISTNVTWALRKRNAQGKVALPYKHFLGYEKGEDGTPVIVEEEAKIVRKIYSSYLSGKTPYTIAKELTKKGIETPGGSHIWNAPKVLHILTNEKYSGNAILQKTYTEDYLTHKRVKNTGQVQMWYVENSHPAIIDPSQFRYVQMEIQKRKACGADTLSYSPFAGHVFCSLCNSNYGRKTWHSTDKYKTTVWCCNNRYKTDNTCHSPSFREDNLKDAFVMVFNTLIQSKEEIISLHLNDNFKCTELQEKVDELTEKSRRLREIISSWSAYKSDRNFKGYITQYNKIQTQRENINNAIAKRKCLEYKTRLFLKVLRNRKESISKFSAPLFRQTVDRIIVCFDSSLEFTFLDGTKRTIKVENGVRDYERRNESTCDTAIQTAKPDEDKTGMCLCQGIAPV